MYSTMKLLVSRGFVPRGSCWSIRTTSTFPYFTWVSIRVPHTVLVTSERRNSMNNRCPPTFACSKKLSIFPLTSVPELIVGGGGAIWCAS